MLRTILNPLLIAGFAMVLAAPAQAVTSARYPYCLQGRSSPGWSNCNFATRAVLGHGQGQKPDLRFEPVLPAAPSLSGASCAH